MTATSSAQTLHGEPISEVFRRWTAEGPMLRTPTGFATLDAACRGGLPVPWRVVVVGAPSAGKTAFVMVLLQRFAKAGLVCGMLGVDEEADDLAVRAAQMLGFSIEQCEGRDVNALRDMVEASSGTEVRIYDYSTTVEAAAADVAQRASAVGKLGVLAIDSIQTARSDAAAALPRAAGPRENVEANMRAMRAAATSHRLMVIATSEANRSSYRSDEAAATSDEMAAGKESSAIEYAAQTLIMLRTPKKYPDHVRVFVPKNRRGARSRFEFYLRLNREMHELAECADPTVGDSAHAAESREDAKRRAARFEAMKSARILANVVRTSPGVGERELIGLLHAAGHPWRSSKLDGAKTILRAGLDGERLVNTGTPRRSSWRLEPYPPGQPTQRVTCQEANAVDTASDASSRSPERVHALPLRGSADTHTPKWNTSSNRTACADDGEGTAS